MLALSAMTGDPAKLYRVRVIRDSVARGTKRLSTFRLMYPRSVLPEFNTHRALSRSTKSSRAVPPERVLAAVRENPVRPLRYGARKPGMGAGADLPPEAALAAARGWDNGRRDALAAAELMTAAGAAKEEANRLLEPFALTHTVVTSCHWDNFFAQRCHEDAWLPFRFLARAMWVAYLRSEPTELQPGEWHLPFITDADRAAVASDLYAPQDFEPDPFPPGRKLGDWREYHLCRWSAARCARVSYGRADGTATGPEADDRTWANLVGLPGDTAEDRRAAAWTRPEHVGFGTWPYRPVHGSPMEHQAAPLPPNEHCARRCGNLAPGWVQFRKLLGGECVREFQPPAEVTAAWASAIPPDVFSDRDPE